MYTYNPIPLHMMTLQTKLYSVDATKKGDESLYLFSMPSNPQQATPLHPPVSTRSSPAAIRRPARTAREACRGDLETPWVGRGVGRGVGREGAGGAVGGLSCPGLSLAMSISSCTGAIGALLKRSS